MRYFTLSDVAALQCKGLTQLEQIQIFETQKNGQQQWLKHVYQPLKSCQMGIVRGVNSSCYGTGAIVICSKCQ